MIRKAIVTAGSAVTMLDDVRCVSLHKTMTGVEREEAISLWHNEMQNIFRGALGVLLAKELVARGIPCTLLVRKDTLGEIEPLEGLSVQSFKTFAQLETRLFETLQEEQPDLVFMAAAPPDYAPTKLEGKIRSNREEISITYRRTPKLLDRIRSTLGEAAFIVGFKLLVGVSEEELTRVGQAQIERAQTDLCVGNDLERINPKKGIHPMQLMLKDGSVIHLNGLKADVARRLVDTVLSQSQHAK